MQASHLVSPPQKKSRLSLLDVRLKMVALFMASVFSVLFDSPWSLCVLLAFSLLAAGAAWLGWGRWKLLLLMAVMVTWGTMFSQAIFYYGEPRTVLLSLVENDTFLLGRLLGEVNVYLEGFEHGAIQSLRTSTMLILGLTLCWTTDNAAMLRGLLAFKLPFVLAFMTVTAVRFLPIIIQEFAQVSLAWQLRGGNLFYLNPYKMLMAWLKIFRPVLINCYRRSATLALSIQTRAFTPQSGHLQPGGRSMPAREWTALVLLCLITLAAVALKSSYWLYLAGIYYHPALRPCYEFCRLYF